MTINVYTDASVLTQQGNKSGVGVVVTIEGEIYKTVGQYIGRTDIVTAELLAILIGLKEARDVSKHLDPPLVRICSDCVPALDIATGDSSPQKAMTQMIAEKIDEICFELDAEVDFQWIRSHNGNKYNEMADQIAYEHAHN